jgi:uncharacterized protein (DUF4415 family)
MKKPLPPMIDEEGEVRELTLEDMAHFRPAREALPAALYEGLAAMKNRGGRPKSAAPKIQTAIRFEPEVLAALRATGRGWQTRVNDVMKEWVARHATG